MKRVSSIVGLAAIAASDGKLLGNVEQVYLHAGGKLVQGLMIKPRRLIAGRCFARLKRVRMFGEISVIVEKAEKPPALAEQVLTFGQKVLGTTGEKLGWITDILIDENDGRVISVELSQGYRDDWMKGRTMLNDFTVQPCGVIAVERSLSS